MGGCPVKRILFQMLGGLFLLLGGIGIALPLLPTTPFVLCAAWCFGKASPSLVRRLEGSPYFGQYLENYRLGTGIRASARWQALIFLWSTLAISAFFWDSAHGRILLAFVAIGVTIHLCTIKTRREEEPAWNEEAATPGE